MRSITRPLTTAATATLLVLALAACGDGGDDKASDDKSPSKSSSSAGSEGTGATDDATDAPTGAATAAADSELCTAVANVVKVVGTVGSGEPNEEQWGQIQDAYGELGDADLPDGATDEQEKGRDIAVGAITGLDYADAKKAFGAKDGSGIPGVSKEDNAKAEAFFTWAAGQCPAAVGAPPAASSATVAPSSATAP